jgi:transcriptional regulator with XRE-family HTH domain
MTKEERHNVLVGSRVKQIRKDNNLTQDELAKNFNVSISLIKQVENGHKPLTINLAKMYVEWYKASLDYIYFG